MPAVAGALGAASVKTQLSAPASGTTRGCCSCRRCRARGSPRPTAPASTRFAQRYKAKFSSEPTRLATLAYDAVTLAGALARKSAPTRSACRR